MRPLLKLVPDNTNIDFLRARRIAILFSILLLIGSVALLATRGLNFGVDFVGGQLFRVTFQSAPPLDGLRDRLQALGQGEATIQTFGQPNQISIRMQLPEGGADDAARAATRVRATIAQAYPGARFDAVETVSGKVSRELAWDGGLALLFAMIGIAGYIWIRFEWQFGVGAIVSLIHDLVITLGFFSLTQIEFSLNVVAALLTLIGYSLNDTVVTYDRVRENLRKYRKMEIQPLLNLSVNETLSRTIATNVAVLLAVLALVFIGPETIYGLTIGILFGVIIGTYSSVYIANPILIWTKVSGNSFVPAESKQAGAERVRARELP